MSPATGSAGLSPASSRDPPRKRRRHEDTTASASARELTRGLELRRVGIDLISQVMADADATELQGDREALG